MSRQVSITKDVERRTYIKGTLQATYIGFLDELNSVHSYSNIYNLEITKASVEIQEKDIQKWQNGEIFDDFRYIQTFPSKLPSDTDFRIVMGNDQEQHYRLSLLDLRIKDPELSDRVVDGKMVLGTLKGEICGYFVHLDKVSEIIYVEENNEGLDENPEQPIDDNGKDSGPTFTFAEVMQAAASVFSVAIGALVLIPLVLYGWQLILGAGGLWSVFYLSSKLPTITRRVGQVFNSLLLILFILLFIAGLVSIINHGYITAPKAQIDQGKEQSQITPLPEPTPIPVSPLDSIRQDTSAFQQQDSLITHYRTWKGYRGEQYSGLIQVKLSDQRSATMFRNGLPYPEVSLYGLNNIFEKLKQFDENKLAYIYLTFDSIRQTNHLDNARFAEMVVSCIQDIPYTLILEQECNPWIYPDAFIKDYLSAGGRCRPFEKFGILTPAEFIATLDGDCDTRSLLLFSVLARYGYDVTLLVSNFYKHAIIGVNLPYRGTNKIINGKRYVVWETTARSIPPGEFPSNLSNMNLWTPVLISKQ